MTTGPFTVWCNAQFPPSALTILEQAVKPPHRLVLSQRLEQSNLVGAGPDEEARSADIALGQPNPDDSSAAARRCVNSRPDPGFRGGAAGLFLRLA